MTRAVVVMGPSGCGKTTLARALALSTGWEFIEADELHPAANIAKMRTGQPLDDTDRAPWLDRVGAAIAAKNAPGAVVACSVLKRRYRDALRHAADTVVFVLPMVPRETLVRRLTERTGHFMPLSPLDSQLADLEPLVDGETGFSIDGTASLSAQLRDIRSRLKA